MEGKKDSETNSYGTYEMSVDQIRKLVGLEVYSARSWLNSKSSYAGDRIGVPGSTASIHRLRGRRSAA